MAEEKDTKQTVSKKMIVACDNCKTYNSKNEGNYLCACRGYCPGLEKDQELREYLYNRKYRKTIETRLGDVYHRPGSFIGKLVCAVINDKEHIGTFVRNFGMNQLYFLVGDKKGIAVNLKDITYIKEEDE